MIVENLSGIPVEGAIKIGSTSLNGCNGGEQSSSGLGLANDQGKSGLYVNQEAQSALTYIPPNGKVQVTINVGGCQGAAFKNVRTTDVGTSLVIRAGDKTFVLPINATNVPVRSGGFL